MRARARVCERETFANMLDNDAADKSSRKCDIADLN